MPSLNMEPTCEHSNDTSCPKLILADDHRGIIIAYPPLNLAIAKVQNHGYVLMDMSRQQ